MIKGTNEEEEEEETKRGTNIIRVERRNPQEFYFSLLLIETFFLFAS